MTITLTQTLNIFPFIHIILYTDQQQPRPTYQQVVPNEVTCNPTDDTARDDELSNSFASNRRDYSHGQYYSTNPTVKHHNRLAFPPHDANQAHLMQPRLQMTPALPPMVQSNQPNAAMDYNPQMYLSHSLTNTSSNEQNYQSTQITNERHSTPPVKSFISCNTAGENDPEATSGVYHDSFPWLDANKSQTSINHDFVSDQTVSKWKSNAEAPVSKCQCTKPLRFGYHV